MGIIKLTKGVSTVVDDNLLSWLSQYSWYAQYSGTGYRPARRLKFGGRKMIYMYHQIMCIEPWDTELVIDHKNRDPLDNRVENLRVVTQQVNMQNRKDKSQGISIDRTYNRFKAYINGPYGTRINVGTFLTREEAILAREAYLACHR